MREVGAEEEEDAEEDEEGEEAGTEEEAAKESRPGTQDPSSPSSQPPGPHPHEWTYEEQFKQVGPPQCQALPPHPSSLGKSRARRLVAPPPPLPSAGWKDRDTETCRETGGRDQRIDSDKEGETDTQRHGINCIGPH